MCDTSVFAIKIRKISDDFKGLQEYIVFIAANCLLCIVLRLRITNTVTSVYGSNLPTPHNNSVIKRTNRCDM